MADGDWGMGYGSKNNAEYVKAQKRLIPKIKKFAFSNLQSCREQNVFISPIRGLAAEI